MNLNPVAKEQIQQCLDLAKETFGSDLLAVYLYGSVIVGGLQKYSDIDLFIVANRSTTREEKEKLAKALLKISGIYMKSNKPPVELTIVEKSAINPWRYPPKFDFQYGDWLRNEFESGNIEPWTTKEMPDLALLITQILSASNILFGANPDQLLPTVPRKDVIAATKDALPNLLSELDSDTRNVLLTLARIWSWVATDSECSKPAAADWAVERLPDEYRSVMKRAKAICIGDERECWDDMLQLIKPCAKFMLDEINTRIEEISLSGDIN